MILYGTWFSFDQIYAHQGDNGDTFVVPWLIVQIVIYIGAMDVTTT